MTFEAAAPARTASERIVERLRLLEGGGLRTFVEERPLVWERARGAWIEDADGRPYLDLYAGFAVAATGHQHPRVVEAVRRQAADLMHCPSAHPSRVRAEFLEAVASIAPPGLRRVLPAVTGAMANEIALAVARTRRPGTVITFAGSYFGRAAGVVGLAGKARYREALGLPATGRFVPYPYPLRMGEEATDRVLGAMEEVARREAPVSAVVLEPIQGNGGVLVPPDDFLPRVRDFCDRAGALLLLDEIQSGFGRTGRTWAAEHAGLEPDLMTIGKGLGGGMPAAAVLGRPGLLTWEPDSYTSTFLTNAVNLAAATAAVTVLVDEGLPARAARLGPPALERLRTRLAGVPSVGEVRGRGLWFAVELVEATGRPDAAAAARAALRARERGVVVGRGGHDENVVKVSPPLVIDEADLARGLDTLADVIREGNG